MPRIPASTEPPSFHEIVTDLRKFGPLTQMFAESQVGTVRTAKGDPLRGQALRTRAVGMLHERLTRGDVSEVEIARAMSSFYIDRAQAAEMAQRGLAPLTHDYK